MLKKRIIPCLDVMNGRTVKGVQFQGLRDAGDPVALAAQYAEQGADELVFLDITATHENRATLLHLVREVAAAVNIPFTVGGGISTVDQASLLLQNGADKVSLNSAAVRNPQLIEDIAKRYGNQCVVVAIDARKTEAGGYEVFLAGGRIPTGLDAFAWANQAAQMGAGEILLTSMDEDGRKQGFELNLTDQMARQLTIPVIASGGAGSIAHFTDLFLHTQASAALAASIFHYGEVPIPTLKQALKAQNIPVR